MVTLAYQSRATLADLPLMPADRVYRERVDVAGSRSPGRGRHGRAVAFWARYDSLPPGQVPAQVGPLLSKLRAVQPRRFAASLFGVGTSTFRPADILDGDVLLFACDS